MLQQPTWRPQPLWIPIGLLLGGFAGAITGAVLMSAVALLDSSVSFARDASPLGTLGAVVPVLLIGSIFGGVAGSMVGLAVGAQLTFLVGAHLALDAARRRAHRLGYVLPPLTMAVPYLLADGGSWPGTGTEALWWAVCLGGSSLLGGPLARRVAGWGPTRRATS